MMTIAQELNKFQTMKSVLRSQGSQCLKILKTTREERKGPFS